MNGRLRRCLQRGMGSMSMNANAKTNERTMWLNENSDGDNSTKYQLDAFKPQTAVGISRLTDYKLISISVL
ncbi:unnamed protein product [Ceratitis capitata]|uniref:(Mediterranean fruit fly) hypothetical protein n=1 Tax=Ceratitis capitata TaxID=7213 RepID=A0A811V3B5_CERCA|nr:unnamed protein product [Ceratitis capitata]